MRVKNAIFTFATLDQAPCFPAPGFAVVWSRCVDNATRVENEYKLRKRRRVKVHFCRWYAVCKYDRIDTRIRTIHALYIGASSMYTDGIGYCVPCTTNLYRYG